METVITIISFLFFTCLVAFLTWRLTRNSDVVSDEGYFLAGRSLTGMGAVFALLVMLQLVLANAGFRRESAYEQVDVEAVDLAPWKLAPVVGGILCLFAVSVYVFFAL